ncbi:MAG TPA: hypothetical protein VL284_15825 [Thermoanaerobaculia bacterium]|nr:hypothetical protein [Thermoanaerobaculia bacterium]
MRIDWCAMPDRNLREAFFDQSIARRLSLDPGSLSSSSISTLPAENDPADRFAGFIFHGSRCGSTLVAQMLAAIDGHSVLSEPAILDQVLRSEEGGTNLLRGVMNAFRRWGAGRRLFVKFIAATVVDAPRISDDTADVPRLFLYRDPVEVVTSLVGSQSERIPPGLMEKGLLPQADRRNDMRPAEFWARVVGRQYEAALRFAIHPVNYTQVIDENDGTIWRHFGLHPTEAEKALMSSVRGRNAKEPSRSYEVTTRTATPEIRAAVDRFAFEAYERLERARRSLAVN